MGKNLEGQIPPPQWVRDLPFEEPPCPYCGKETTRLKELNREMVGMLEDVLYYELPSNVYATIKELLAKAEGEGE